MATKTTTPTKEHIGRIGQRRQSDFVAFSQQGDGVLVKPKRLVDADDILTPAEAKKVRRGMKQIKEGRFKNWRDVQDELGR